MAYVDASAEKFKKESNKNQSDSDVASPGENQVDKKEAKKTETKKTEAKSTFIWPTPFAWTMYLLGLFFFAYFAAAVLGFFGILAPFKAALDPNTGSSVLLFVVGIIPVVFIMIHYGANLVTLKNCIIVALVPLALFVIVYTWFPLVFSKTHFKAEEKNRESILLKQSTGSMLHVEKGKVVQVYILRGFNFKKPFGEDENESKFKVLSGVTCTSNHGPYPVKDVKDIRRDGHYLLISVYLPQDEKHPEKFPVGWVRLGKEFGTKVVAKENLVPKKEDKVRGSKKVDYVIYGPGQVKVFRLKAGEISDHYIRAQGVPYMEFYLKSGEFEIITRSGKVYDPKNLPKYFPEDFIIFGVTDTDMRIKFL